MKNLLTPLGVWISAVVFLMSSYISVACGPSLYTDESRFSLFRKETMANVALDPFHYNHNYYSGFTNASFQTERSNNIEEWYEFGDKSFSKKSTGIMQYQIAADSFLKAYNRKDFSDFEGNDFMEFLLKKKNKKALEYFAFAKQVESAQISDDDGWDMRWQSYNPDKLFKPESFKELTAIAAKHLKDRRMPQFLKERYAFQYVKSAYYDYYYNENNAIRQSAIEVYDKYLAQSSSIVAQWALIYYADLQSDKKERIKYLLKAFDKSDDKKLRAFSLLKTETDNLMDFYHTFDDPYYKNLIDIILAIRNTGRALDQIKWLYQTDKNSPYLQLLMTREINKLEDWIWSNPMLHFHGCVLGSGNNEEDHSNDFSMGVDEDYWERRVDTFYGYYAGKNLQSDVAYMKEVIQFFKSMNFGDDIKKSNFREIALIHLYSMSGDYTTAEEMMSLLSRSQTDEALMQINYERVILLPHVKDVNNQNTKDLIAMAIFDLEQRMPKVYMNKNKGTQKGFYLGDDWDNGAVDTTSFNNIDPQLLVYLGRVYLEKGYRLEGALFLTSAGIAINEYSYIYGYEDSMAYGGLAFLEKYCLPEDIDRLMSLKRKQFKNKFEQYFLPTVVASDQMLIDLKGTLQLRAGDYKAAVETFSQLPEDFWETKWMFKEYLPQNKITYVNTLQEDELNQKEVYSLKSKKLIADELLSLQEDTARAVGDAAKAKAYLHYANALYNISYFGTAWMAYAYGKSSTELNVSWKDEYFNWNYYYLHPSPQNHTEHYYELEAAQEAYRRAQDLGGKTDVAAQAAMMLALCDQQTLPYKQKLKNPYFYRYSNKKTDRSELYRNLKAQYGHTASYQLNATKCPDVR